MMFFVHCQIITKLRVALLYLLCILSAFQSFMEKLLVYGVFDENYFVLPVNNHPSSLFVSRKIQLHLSVPLRHTGCYGMVFSICNTYHNVCLVDMVYF